MQQLEVSWINLTAVVLSVTWKKWQNLEPWILEAGDKKLSFVSMRESMMDPTD